MPLSYEENAKIGILGLQETRKVLDYEEFMEFLEPKKRENKANMSEMFHFLTL